LRLLEQITAADWLACDNVEAMCKVLRPQVYGALSPFSTRKWRLFGVACVRRVAHVFKDERTRGLVEAVEWLANGLLSQEGLERIWEQARNPPNPDQGGFPIEADVSACAYQALVAAGGRWIDAPQATRAAAWARAAVDDPDAEERVQARLLRDIFGNPFRSVVLDPNWLMWNAGVVVRIAQQMDEERDFTGMPVLGDALEEAGCTDPDILRHCREPGEHARGCWILDLCLGKT
jgi:hypothetical protein